MLFLDQNALSLHRMIFHKELHFVKNGLVATLPLLEQRSLRWDDFEVYFQQVDMESAWNQLIAQGKDHIDYTDERIPYWADVWPSSIALAQVLIRNSNLVTDCTCCEIGCGAGIPGIVAGLFGASVLLTDYVEEACAIARHNWELNQSVPAPVQQLDWRNPGDEILCNLLIASDVAYEKRNWAALLHCFDSCLQNGGTVLLSDPGRDLSKPFFQILVEQGVVVRHLKEQINWNSQITVIDIYQLQTPNSPKLLFQ